MYKFDFNAPELGREINQDWFTNLKLKFNPKLLVILPLIIIPFFFFKSLGLITLLIAITIGASYIGQKTKLKRFGLEFVTFTTVITGVYFGVKFGIIAGILLLALHEIITRRAGVHWIVVIPLFGLMGALAGLYSSANILLLGFALTIMSHGVFVAFRALFSGFPSRYVPYMVLNILFNTFLFYRFAPMFF